jgi:hypothetical protein
VQKKKKKKVIIIKKKKRNNNRKTFEKQAGCSYSAAAAAAAAPFLRVFLSLLGRVARLLLAFHSAGSWNRKLGFSTSAGKFQYFC